LYRKLQFDGQICMTFNVDDFCGHLLRKSKFAENWTKIPDT